MFSLIIKMYFLVQKIRLFPPRRSASKSFEYKMNKIEIVALKFLFKSIFKIFALYLNTILALQKLKKD